jgi:predicted NBD/HSP70 family sugar kinase
MYNDDKRIVVTLDAGGSNFVFGAIRGNEFIVEPIKLPSNADKELAETMQSLESGFRAVFDRLPEKPVAISFAFPGPADYPRGVIYGYLPNFPAFRDGVALGAFLEERFGVPVFINNDGDLYAYGEALAGALPEINARLERAGSVKRYKNLIGYTLGTGFGFGLTVDGRMHIGDNSCSETFCLPHKLMPDIMVEEGVAIRAVKRVYAELSGSDASHLTPLDICRIAQGHEEGDRDAARRSFERMGEVAGDAIAYAASLLDGLVVIGGGLTGAHEHYMPALLAEMRRKLQTLGGDGVARIQPRVYDLDDEAEFREFARGESRTLTVYGSDRTVTFDPVKRIGVMTSRLGADRAIQLGAYAYALNNL